MPPASVKIQAGTSVDPVTLSMTFTARSMSDLRDLLHAAAESMDRAMTDAPEDKAPAAGAKTRGRKKGRVASEPPETGSKTKTKTKTKTKATPKTAPEVEPEAAPEVGPGTEDAGVAPAEARMQALPILMALYHRDEDGQAFVRAILSRYGVKTFKDIGDEHYPGILAEVKAFADAGADADDADIDS